MKVTIAGASGLIGNHLTQILLKNTAITEVVALVRRQLNFAHPKLRQIVVSFDEVDLVNDSIKDSLALYCCLGTTKRKSPNTVEYRKIEHDYPVLLAKIASDIDIEQFHLVSALGANEKSKIFYNKVKGETEKDVKGFSFRSIHIYQPSLLTGRQENRPYEKLVIQIMKFINPLLIGNLRKYQSISAQTVAKTMANQTFKNIAGIHEYSSEKIRDLSESPVIPL
jgi:hypothetical protein